MHTKSPGHLKTFDYLGCHRYSLTFCTNGREQHFTAATAVDLARKHILRAATETQFVIIVYCFMPDHLHLLVEGQTESSDGKRFIARAKQYSAFYFKQAYRKALWQRYGYEHVLRDDEVTSVVARYILENPIRAGLVQRVEDYPFVGSERHSLADLIEGVAESGSRRDGSG
jgi:putative transposase